jgi:hypothetical protein
LVAVAQTDRRQSDRSHGDHQHHRRFGLVELPDRPHHQQHPGIWVMTKAERLAAVFAIAFAIIYAPTMDLNWTLATYHPLQGVWEWFKAPPKSGGSPAMYWYGFVFTAALVGLAVAALAALVPNKVMERIPWSTLAWVVTLCSIAYICYVLLPYATKT